MKIIFRISLICFSLLITHSTLVIAQSITWQRSYTNHYTQQTNLGIDVCQADGGNFYIISTNPNPNSFNVIKINAYGDTIWTRTVDSIRNNYCGCTSSGDGGVVCSADGAFAIRFDKDGNQLWKKSYGFQALCYKIIRTSDGNYVICGQYGGWYGLIFKINANGNLIWERDYTNYFAQWYEYIIESHDYNYLAVGFRSLTSDSTNALITKIDTSGHIIWEKEYVLFNRGCAFISIDKINSGYIVLSNTFDSISIRVPDFIKIDELGNILFLKKFNGEKNWTYLSIDIKDINENRYLFCSNGYYRSDSVKTIIFITDSLGNIIHERIFNGITGYAKLLREQTINNGDLIFAGSSDFYNINYATAWVVRTDSNLFVVPYSIKKLSSIYPSKFKLFQNYPNPFNPTTKIRFQIPLLRGVPEGWGVSIKIFDILGREVATLVNKPLQPGTYEVEWPAPSGDATIFASGVYFYQLNAGDFIQTKKMVLIK